ncbi:hypothetical protein TrVFT333_009158 [Trichoderma virens FT-333]|nr:hypothetical protein TrVFT333_009158 [Trichoderma virens FT-333]
MAFQEPFDQDMVADPQSQLLTSFTGGNNMLEATKNDTSYRSFAAEADGTHKYHASSGSTSSPEAIRSDFQNAFHLSNDVRSPQTAFDSSFLVVPSPVDTSSDWPQQQPCAANNDGLVFSSSGQGSSLGRSHRPPLGIETDRLVHYGPRKVINTWFKNFGCDGREDGRDCSRCASSHSNAPKPFVCAPASFFELVQQGSTALLALHILYPSAFAGYRQPIELPSEINIRRILRCIGDLQRSYDAIRVYGRKGLLYELDLHACWVYINSTCSPIVHPFRQFINGLKVQRQDTWKSCIRDGHSQPLNEENLCDTLLALDDMAPWVTYTLRPKHSDSFGRTNDELQTALFPDHPSNREVIIMAAQLSRIIGRKLELQFYDHLKKALANPSICRELVLDVGRTLMSLRRRLTQWTYYWANVSFHTTPEHESHVNEEAKGDDLASDPMNRLKQLCQVLYVYFCYMRRRLSPSEHEGMRTMMVLYPDSVEEVEESFPQYESLDGFEEWLLFKDQPVAETNMDDQM